MSIGRWNLTPLLFDVSHLFPLRLDSLSRLPGLCGGERCLGDGLCRSLRANLFD